MLCYPSNSPPENNAKVYVNCTLKHEIGRKEREKGAIKTKKERKRERVQLCEGYEDSRL